MVLEERLFHGKDYEDNDLVICTRTGKPMIPRNLRKEFYNLTENSDFLRYVSITYVIHMQRC